MDKIRTWSFWFFMLSLVVVAVFNLATPFLTILFSVFVLERLTFFKRKGVAIALFLVVVLAVVQVLIFFIGQAIETLPRVASESIPLVMEHAKRFRLELPFQDYVTFKDLALDEAKDQIGKLAGFAQIGIKEFVLFVLALIVSISLFVNQRLDLLDTKFAIERNVYVEFTREISLRFQRFFESFSTVMGAQILISTINTFFTGIFVVSVSLPLATLVIVLTFLCGLIPIVGNLISNTIIFGIAITVSPKLAIASLIFLFVLHKLEYFLNSKIVGSRIKTPIWLTLLALIVGEEVMGVPGMILAPVLLHYFRQETAQIAVT